MALAVERVGFDRVCGKIFLRFMRPKKRLNFLEFLLHLFLLHKQYMTFLLLVVF